MWSPSVTRSTPAPRKRLYKGSVRPEPPAAFSALAMTQSILSSGINSGSTRLTKFTPGVPTMSPIKRIRILAFSSLGVFHGARLAHHRDFNLAGVVQLLLD